MNFRSASIAIVVAAAAVISVTAQAGDYEQKSVQVSFADLDILNADGHAALAARIDKAAGDACGPVGGRELQLLQAFRDCRSKAIADAMPAAHAAFAAAQQKSLMASDMAAEQISRTASR